MKYWILAVFIFFAACKKCGECICKWTYQEYKLNNTGTGHYKEGAPFAGPDEVVDYCGEDEEDAYRAEYKKTTPTVNSGYIEGTRTCNCYIH